MEQVKRVQFFGTVLCKASKAGVPGSLAGIMRGRNVPMQVKRIKE